MYKRAPLHHAASSGNYTAAKKLIETGNADVNQVTIGGETPLMKAAAYNQQEIAELLIKNGANVLIKN